MWATLALALLLLAAPVALVAPQAGKLHRIGILIDGAVVSADLAGPDPLRPTVKALLRGLQDLGHVYGQNFVTEPRSTEGRPERHAALAAELVGLKVDVIVSGGPPLLALKQATATIPVVMAGAGDAVRLGLVQSLARPSGNFTGLSLQHSELARKRLELLTELVPGATVVAVLWHRASAFQLEETDVAARRLGRRLHPVEIRDAADIERAFHTAREARAGALVVIPGAVIDSNNRRIAEGAARNRLPAIYGFKASVEDGGLLSYGIDSVAAWRRAAFYVDKILKGVNPADLPVEQPGKFELVINLKTSKALGLTIPASLLARADQVIE